MIFVQNERRVCIVEVIVESAEELNIIEAVELID